MAVTKTQIVSLAVQLLGHKPVTTLDNADAMVTSAEQAFDLLLPSVIATNNWRFAVTLQQLSLSPIVPDPNTGWQNVYYLPSGWLKTIRVIPNNYVWEIYSNNLIYSNWGTQSPVFMEYCYLPELYAIPMYFWNYFIYEVAIFSCLASAQKPDYFSVLEQKRLTMFAMAAGVDAQNRPQFSQISIPVLDNRYISGIIGPQIG